MQSDVYGPLLVAALRLVGRNRPVFPCGSDQVPLVARSLLATTTGLMQMGACWRRWPDALTGKHMGAASKLVAADNAPKGERGE